MRAHVRVYENVLFERGAFSLSCLYVSEQTLALPDPRKGMEDARRPSEAPFPSSITPSVAHPLMSRTRLQLQGAGKRGRNRAGDHVGVVSREGNLSERGGHSALEDVAEGVIIRRYTFYVGYFSARGRSQRKRNKHRERINGNWCCVHLA